MPHIRRTAVLFSLLLLTTTIALADPVKTANGLVEGSTEKDLADLPGHPLCRAPGWRPALESAAAGPGLERHQAVHGFGAQCMQRRVFNDMVFRAEGMSEDCLYLNVWTPAKKRQRPPAGAGLLLRRRLHCR